MFIKFVNDIYVIETEEETAKPIIAWHGPVCLSMFLNQQLFLTQTLREGMEGMKIEKKPNNLYAKLV